MAMALAFDDAQGQADRGVDGSDDFTSVELVYVSGGPYELEFWPGPPGTGTVRVLVSGHDLDICIQPNSLATCPNIRDFTGAILFKGPPTGFGLLLNFFGSHTISVTSDLTYDVAQTSSFTDSVPLSAGPVTIDIDDDGDVDDVVTLDGTLSVSVDPLILHYAWQEITPNAFDVGGLTTNMDVDRDGDGTIEVDDLACSNAGP